MGSLFMPKMRAIGVPVNDYFVEHFVDIPKYRYNKIPLKTVTKTESGFQLKLNVDDQPEYFIDRKEVMAPTSGGNTSNVFLNMVALYAAMQIDIQFKVIVPEDQSSIAQQDLNRFIYNDVNVVPIYTPIWDHVNVSTATRMDELICWYRLIPQLIRWMMKSAPVFAAPTTFQSLPLDI